jgi:hypothetical protein
MENPARNVERQPQALTVWGRLYASLSLFFAVIPTGEPRSLRLAVEGPWQYLKSSIKPPAKLPTAPLCLLLSDRCYLLSRALPQAN